MADLENDPSVYLFPAFSFDHEIVDFLNESCVEIFEQELESWDRVQETWAQGPELCRVSTMVYSIHSMIFDSADEQLELEEM